MIDAEVRGHGPRLSVCATDRLLCITNSFLVEFCSFRSKFMQRS